MVGFSTKLILIFDDYRSSMQADVEKTQTVFNVYAIPDYSIAFSLKYKGVRRKMNGRNDWTWAGFIKSARS